MSRKPLLAANWKMHKTSKEAIYFIEQVKCELESYSQKADVVICPPFTSIPVLSAALKNSSVKLGAQNIYYEDKGAFTGELSARMIKEFASYVIIGHSERRTLFKESDDDVNRKVKAALSEGLKVILCVGEDLFWREKGQAEDWVCSQMLSSLSDIEDASDIVIAYEPIWAIGSGIPSTPKDAQQMALSLRTALNALFGQKAQGIRILYGGSVKNENINSFMAMPDIDGALVGGASLDADSFLSLLKEAVR